MALRTLALALCAIVPLISAQPAFLTNIPNGDAASRNNSGVGCVYLDRQNCIQNGGLNQFGRDLETAGGVWTTALCTKDSDGDGRTNGEELGDPCCTWVAGGAAPLRTINLSHPGVQGDANTAPKCPTPTPAASASASASAAAAAAASTAASALPSASAAASSGGTGGVNPPVVPPGTGGSGATPSASSSTSVSPSVSVAPVAAGDGIEATASPSDGSGSGSGSGASSPSPSPTDDGSVCFPGRAMVKLDSGSHIPMRNLRVGNRVQVASGKFSEVFMFSHKLSNIKYNFVTLRAETEAKRSVSLSLTKGHFLYVNGQSAPASSVQVGDTVETADDGRAVVMNVSTEMLDGLFNPQTMDGDIVVDGVRASTYTHTVKHVTAHCMLMPVRAAFRYFGLSLTALEGGADRIASALPSEL